MRSHGKPSVCSSCAALRQNSASSSSLSSTRVHDAVSAQTGQPLAPQPFCGAGPEPLSRHTIRSNQTSCSLYGLVGHGECSDAAMQWAWAAPELRQTTHVTVGSEHEHGPRLGIQPRTVVGILRDGGVARGELRLPRAHADGQQTVLLVCRDGVCPPPSAFCGQSQDGKH